MMNTELIKLFNGALIEKDTLNFANVNQYAMQRGYLVMPEACNTSVMEFLNEVSINPNATFYKTWEDVTSKSRLDLYLDQVLHYMTTYGTDFALGNGYVPNDGAEDVPSYKEFKVIKAFTVEELYDRCLGLLTSGVALKTSTMKVVAQFVVDNINRSTFDIDAIKNREAQVFLSDELGIFPNEPATLLRYIIYKTIGNTMLIKDAETINKIKEAKEPFNFGLLNDNNMKALASCFLRYKDIFLAFKHHATYPYAYGPVSIEPSFNAPYINKLRRMAVKYHKPMKQAFWQNIFNINASAEDIQKHLDELTSYKKVALMQACLDRATTLDHQFYLVRNQKAFLRKEYKPNTDIQYLMLIYTTLRMSLIETLKSHSTKNVVTGADSSTGESIIETVPVVVKTVAGMKITLPSSEKSFIGNYPFGTSYAMTSDNFFGVYWKNEWGTRDYDLSFVGVDGTRIGWNGYYYTEDQDIVFSGDMTNASPEAAEVLSIKKNCPFGIIKVNQYSDCCKSKFRFFFGQQENLKFDCDNYYGRRNNNNCGYMVDPNCIKLTIDVEHEANRKENTVAVCNGTDMVLMSITTGNKSTSNIRNAENIKMMSDSIIHKSKCFVDAAEILAEAGYKVVDETYTLDADIDFKNLDKDSLIALMS